MSESPEEALERGRKEGRVDATLDQHSQHLKRINGNIERFAESVESLETAVRLGLEEVREHIRAIQEERRLDQERVETARKVLAEETERRRATQERERVERADALAIPVRKWAILSSKGVVVSTVATILLAAFSYLGYRVATIQPAAPVPIVVTVTTPSR